MGRVDNQRRLRSFLQNSHEAAFTTTLLNQGVAEGISESKGMPLEFEIGGKIYRPQPGEELSIPSGVLHSVRNIGSSTAHWLYGYRQNSRQ